MRFLISLILMLSVLSCTFSFHVPQEQLRYRPYHQLVLSPSIKNYLDQSWDSTNVMQVERVYCISEFEFKVFDDSTDGVIVNRIAPGRVIIAFPSKIWYFCNKPLNGISDMFTHTPTIHTHPPSNCDTADSNCTYDDSRRYECLPSDIDINTVNLWNIEFGIVQCWKGVYTMYAFNLPK